jgi:ABC-type uncharacterized transport system substrate-binding protein
VVARITNELLLERGIHSRADIAGSRPVRSGASLAIAALRQQTRTIPIVFVNVSDPVGQGFVESLARPGGNITGFTRGRVRA